MALVSLPSPIFYPGFPMSSSGPNPNSESTLTTAGHYIAYIMSAQQDMVVSHVGIKLGTVAGSPTCTVSIETLDASGFPSGSAGFGSTNGTTATLTSNAYVLTALGGSATITKGSFYAVKFTLASGTSVILQNLGGLTTGAGNWNLPYKVTNTGTPTKSQFGVPSVTLGSNSTTFYNLNGCVPFTSLGGQQFNNTNSAKRGLRFIPPMNCRAIGMRWYTDNTNGADYNISLMNDAGTELSSSSTAVDGDFATGGGAPNIAFFDNAVTLTAGTAYRIAVEPTTASNVGIYAITLPSSSYYGASMGGVNCTYASLVSGTWTDSTTVITMMDVILDQVDNGSGGGGGGSVVGVIGA